MKHTRKNLIALLFHMDDEDIVRNVQRGKPSSKQKVVQKRQYLHFTSRVVLIVEQLMNDVKKITLSTL
ncbi:hypothetical protein PsorP6_007097 [Peronosclerospora sorghi]|uniref:Uncharacterized protein n=1 Tax=Peronosclerospora sorghi TaxID=230839 RepID=A0ACC0WAR7_9STRA|nr:hypothetical protein PsorP6_007097 [Peronosclerospora sorghi]